MKFKEISDVLKAFSNSQNMYDEYSKSVFERIVCKLNKNIKNKEELDNIYEEILLLCEFIYNHGYDVGYQ